MADPMNRKTRWQRGFTLPGVVLLTCLAMSVSTLAHADAATRQEAIAEALGKTGGDSKVIGVREETTKDGRIVFAVKVLSNGRVRVFRIPKSS